MFGMTDEDLFVFLGAVSNDTVLGVEEATLIADDEVFDEIGLHAETSKIKGCLFFARKGAYFYTEPKNVHYDWQRQLFKFKKLKTPSFVCDAKKKTLTVEFTSKSGKAMTFTLALEREATGLTQAFAEYSYQ